MSEKTRWNLIIVGTVILLGISLAFSIRHSIYTFTHLQNHYPTGYLAIEMTLPAILFLMILFGIKLLRRR